MSSNSSEYYGKKTKFIHQNALSVLQTVRGMTGLVFDKGMADHHCLWDENHPECPGRFTRVIERCKELQLIDRCHQIEPRMGTLEEILLKHTQRQVDILKSTENETDKEKLEELSSHYEAIYFHPTTFRLSKLAVGSTIELVDKILQNEIQNGMAIIRPPGHHAMKAEYNGFCLFNNVAIAAQHALDNCGVDRILIVDYDVHHGQGTQQLFYNDPRVLYFSIHRYEHGTIYPSLRESDFDCIGEGDGLGYNFNLPLNKIGMTNGDYLAIWQQILLPVASEYQPNLIIISAGYDSAYGCPEGEMEITPAFYAHLVSPLMSFAQGRVAAVLEGGYCLDSLAEGAAITLKTLLGDPCPLVEPLAEPSESMVETILNCIYSHRNYWKCLQVHKTYELKELPNSPSNDFHVVEQKFVGSGEPRPERFETRNFYRVQSNEEAKKMSKYLHQLQITTDLSSAPNRVCYVYDRDLFEENTRIEAIFSEKKLLDRMHKLKPHEASIEEMCLIDTWPPNKRNDQTFEFSALAVGSVLEVVDNVLNGNYQSGICIVNPPDGHAEAHSSRGFCMFNNVALAANYARTCRSLKRVLILDWNIHHGNGTQKIFEDHKNVLYISFYHCENSEPSTEMSNGNRSTLNIPWHKHKMGDSDYVAVFHRIIMPIAYDFNPELVLVSVGFNAVDGDSKVQYYVTPEVCGYFTHWLSSLANGKTIICFEGGYNIDSISLAMAICTKALLGDPLPMLSMGEKALNASCVETIQNLWFVHRMYWKSLKFHKQLPSFNVFATESK